MSCMGCNSLIVNKGKLCADSCVSIDLWMATLSSGDLG